MEGILWSLALVYTICGMFYYVASIPRIARVLMKRNEFELAPYYSALFLFMMALMIFWPYYVGKDIANDTESLLD